jgi:hypothetical protein
VVFVDALAKLFGVLPEPCFAELGDAANVVEMCPSQDVAIRPDYIQRRAHGSVQLRKVPAVLSGTRSQLPDMDRRTQGSGERDYGVRDLRRRCRWGCLRKDQQGECCRIEERIEA